MAKRSRERKRIGGYQRRFADSDFAWLAEQFQEQVVQNPDLTLEEFAIGHGVYPEWIQRFIDTVGNTVTLWHGTTTDRIPAITAEGFRANEGARKKIWFTRRANEARSIAQRRAQQRGEEAVVLRCEIDLGKYSEFDRPQPDHYAFRHAYIAKDVIRSASGMEVHKVCTSSLKKENRDEWIDVTITKASGKLGVLLWLNRYLELKGEAPLNADHPAVQAIVRWTEAQYAGGREDSISEDEMVMQVRIHLEGKAQRGKKAEKRFTVE